MECLSFACWLITQPRQSGFSASPTRVLRFASLLAELSFGIPTESRFRFRDRQFYIAATGLQSFLKVMEVLVFVSKQFEQQLQFGKVAESAIARWLIKRGAYVSPVYEVIDRKSGGPRLFGNGRNLVTPDMLVFTNNGAVWIEAKHKSAFTWHRITERFVTGIDLNHWRDYLQVAHQTSIDVWLVFNHKGGTAKDSPESPRGLFVGDIMKLKDCINHTHENWGRHGMVYWAMESLTRMGDALE